MMYSYCICVRLASRKRTEITKVSHKKSEAKLGLLLNGEVVRLPYITRGII